MRQRHCTILVVNYTLKLHRKTCYLDERLKMDIRMLYLDPPSTYLLCVAVTTQCSDVRPLLWLLVRKISDCMTRFHNLESWHHIAHTHIVTGHWEQPVYWSHLRWIEWRTYRRRTRTMYLSYEQAISGLLEYRHSLHLKYVSFIVAQLGFIRCRCRLHRKALLYRTIPVLSIGTLLFR